MMLKGIYLGDGALHNFNVSTASVKDNLFNICRFIYVVPSISFQTFFVQAFKIAVDSWKFTMSLLYIIWDDWPIFMPSGSNE